MRKNLVCIKGIRLFGNLRPLFGLSLLLSLLVSSGWANNLEALSPEPTFEFSEEEPNLPDLDTPSAILPEDLSSEPTASEADIKEYYGFDFKVTPKLKPQVELWRMIYGELSSSQTIIHDREYMGVVYTVLDFSQIDRSKRRRVEALAVEKYRRILKKLAGMPAINVNQLNNEERRVYQLFEDLDDPKKFYKASSYKRIRTQWGLKNRFAEAIIRSGLYMKTAEEIFTRAGLPIELTRLPFVESFFNINACSKCGALGMWQFMLSTGRLYMKVNSLVDERKDPIIATESAAKLLTANYDMLGSWPLALTAYNHGALGVARGLKKTQTETLEELIESYNHPRFGFASKNFYASFLAAVEVYGNHRRYFGELPILEPLQFDVVELPYDTNINNLVNHCDISKEELKELNPALRKGVINGNNSVPGGYSLKVPPGKVESVLAAYEYMPKGKRYVAKAVLRESANPAEYVKHQVRKGETLANIARRYKTDIESILAANSLKGRNFVRAGQKLRIPAFDNESETNLALIRPVEKKIEKVENKKMEPAVNKQMVIENVNHKVKKGESLNSIAKKYKISLTNLALANNLKSKSRLSKGQVLKVPVAIEVAAKPKVDEEVELARMEEEIKQENQVSVTPQEQIVEDEDAVNAVNKEEKPVTKSIVADDESVENSPVAEITINPHETIGHYAEWARVSTNSLRRLNRLKHGQQIQTGQTILVDFSQVSRDEFDRKRQSFAKGWEEKYLSQYKIEKVMTHILKAKQNVWYLCRYVYKVPLWLVRKYNGDKDLTAIKEGEELLIPILKKL